MRVYCYSSWADPDTQQQLWQLLKDQGWFSAGPVNPVNYFYIPEHLVTWALLIDSDLRAHPHNDWYV